MNDKKNELKIYIDNNLIAEKTSKKEYFSKIKCLYTDECCDKEFEDLDIYLSRNLNIQNYIDLHEKYNSFQMLLFKLIDERNLKDSDVYNKVHIDRRLFSKIRNDKNYHPSKETVILLAMALELNETELEELLDSASYSLPKNNKYDLIIRFCFINRIFKITDVNELLHEYNCKLFNY